MSGQRRNGLGLDQPPGVCPHCGMPMDNAQQKPADNEPIPTYGGESVGPGTYRDDSHGRRDERDYRQGPYDNGSPHGEKTREPTEKPNPFRRRRQ